MQTQENCLKEHQLVRTKLERFKEKIKVLEQKRNDLMRKGQYLQSLNLNAEIAKARQLLEAEIEAQRPRPLRELVPDKDKCGEAVDILIECHLAADYLTAMAYELKDWFDREGLIAYSALPELNAIIKQSEAFASSICKVNQDLSDLMTDNETLINALHKKTQSYIQQRTKPKKRNRNDTSDNRL